MRVPCCVLRVPCVRVYLCTCLRLPRINEEIGAHPENEGFALNRQFAQGQPAQKIGGEQIPGGGLPPGEILAAVGGGETDVLQRRGDDQRGRGGRVEGEQDLGVVVSERPKQGGRIHSVNGNRQIVRVNALRLSNLTPSTSSGLRSQGRFDR